MPPPRRPRRRPLAARPPRPHRAGRTVLGDARRPVPADQLGGRGRRRPRRSPRRRCTRRSRRSPRSSAATSPSRRSGRSRSCRCASWCGPASGPAGLCLGAVCDSPAAVEALRDHWGYPVQLGDVEVARRHDQVRFTAALDGRTVVDLAVHTADVINGGDLMTFDNLHLVRLGDDDERQARPGRPGVHDPPGRPGPAGTCRCPTRRPSACGARCELASPIIGFTFRADTDLVPVRFTIDGVAAGHHQHQAGRVAR